MASMCFSRVLILVWLFPLSLAQGQQHYLQTLAQRGDGVLTLLRRYQCLTDCNLSRFYELNGLRKGQGLKADQPYLLPILVYRYNGKSIRSTMGMNDRPRAERIQAYNERVYAAALQEDDYRNSRVLWVPYHFISCPDERMDEEVSPVVSQASVGPSLNTPRPIGVRGNYALFGSKHAEVPLYDNALRGRVYYIVSGHGGPDPGATGRRAGNTIAEDEYAYDVSLRLTRNLLAHGATVYMIVRDPDDGIRSGHYLKPDKDEVVWGDLPIPRSQSERLTQRSDIINALYQKNRRQGVTYQRLVVVHIDSQSRRERTDMYFYHRKEDPESEVFAQHIHQVIRSKYDQIRKGRGYEGTVSSRDLHMLRETLPTAVFIEMGNIKNPYDQARWVLESNRDLVAEWLCQGIMTDAR